MTLRGYLAAPRSIREAFDRAQARAIERDLVEERRLDEWWEDEFADDPIAQEVKRRRRNDRMIVGAIDGVVADDPPATVPGVNWDERWERRAEAARRHPQHVRATYDRDSDPLFDLALCDVWEEITGEPVVGTVSRCPNPEHEDRWPSCAVRARLFFCNGCEARGSIVDLGAFVYGIEPRGFGFFQIRDRLLAELGMEEAA